MGLLDRGARMSENEMGDRIYRYILDHPGIHLREMHRSLGISLGTLRYHTSRLEARGIVSSFRERYYRRFFALRHVDVRIKKYLGPLRQASPRRIVLTLLSKGELRYRDLRDSVHIPSSTLSLYLDVLVNAGLVVKRTEGGVRSYRVPDPEGVRQALSLMRISPIDELVDRALDIYEESHL